MLRSLFLILAIYFIYKFVFEFLIPMFRATSKMQQNIRSMQDRMDEQFRSQQGQNPQAGQQPPKEEKPVKHEYIDFEEVK